MVQPELFDELHAERKPRRSFLPAFPGRFLRLKVATEDAVFAGLGLVLVVLAGFCLGVERGKRLPASPTAPEPALGVAVARETAARPAPVPERKLTPAIPVAVSPAPAEPEPAVGSEAPGGGYAIQLASYAGIQSAQEEAKRLGRKGFRAQVVRQGHWVELRAVGYRSKAQAQEALAILRKTYRDAFVKRLSSE